MASKAVMMGIAARWWADQLRLRVAPNSGSWLYDQSIKYVREKIDILEPLTETQVTNFQDQLEAALINYTDNVIGVSWDPDPILLAAADKAKLNTIWLPVKTFMRITPDGITVSCGEGAEIEEIA